MPAEGWQLKGYIERMEPVKKTTLQLDFIGRSPPTPSADDEYLGRFHYEMPVVSLDESL